MVSWAWLIVALMVGGCFGCVIASLCVAANDNNKED